jgi:hypothetical protein
VIALLVGDLAAAEHASRPSGKFPCNSAAWALKFLCKGDKIPLLAGILSEPLSY